MIAWLEGVLIGQNEQACILNVAGVGYEVDMLANELMRLPVVGTTMALHIAAVYREDAHSLYGFMSIANRDAFKVLLRANGVGPKMAQSILQYHGADELSVIVAQGNFQALTRAKGVGPKLAKRLVIDLKDKIICRTQPDMAMQSPNVIDDAVEALMKLGFNENRARDMLKGVEGQSVEDMVKQALQQA